MLLVLGALAQAGVDFHEAEFYLGPDGIELELAAPAGEVQLLLAFRFGLYSITEEGDLAPAVAALLVEYNDADRSTCYWNPYRPLPFDAEANEEWAGSEDEPGVYLTEDATTEMVARTLVCRLPRAERWRIRVTPLLGNTEWERRVPTLVGIAERRDAGPRRVEGAEPLPALVELPGEEVEKVAEEEKGGSAAEDVGMGPPVQCPFCSTRFKGGCVTREGAKDYHCRYCSGAVHYRAGTEGFCSVLKEGRRHVYRLARGPAVAGKHVRPAPARPAVVARPEIRRVVPAEAPAVAEDEELPPPEILPDTPVPYESAPAFGASIVPGAPRTDRRMPAFGGGVVPFPPPRPARMPGHPGPP